MAKYINASFEDYLNEQRNEIIYQMIHLLTKKLSDEDKIELLSLISEYLKLL